MRIWEEICIRCNEPFLNNSGSTSFGCPYCEPIPRREEQRAHAWDLLREQMREKITKEE